MSDIGNDGPAPDVLVVGGGIIGLAIAWRAVRAVCLVLILVFVIEYIFCLCKLHF